MGVCVCDGANKGYPTFALKEPSASKSCHSVSLHGNNTKATRRLCDIRVPRIKILKGYMPLESGPRAPGSFQLP